MDYWSIASQSVILNKLFTAYEKLHPNITIQRDAVPFANLIPKADQEAASHTLPNLIAMDNPDVAAFASTGALTQLDSYFPGQLNSTNYYAGPLQTTLYQGKTYSMPVGSNDLALYYNIKDFQAAGVTPPATWADLTADAKALTKGNTFGFAFSAIADEEATFQYEPFLWSNNGNLSQIDSAQAVAALAAVDEYGAERLGVQGRPHLEPTRRRHPVRRRQRGHDGERPLGTAHSGAAVPYEIWDRFRSGADAGAPGR